MSDLVDSHCHASNRWYEPVETLLFEMDRCGVAKALLIQLLGGTDNSAMISAASKYPERFAWVAMIDPNAPDWRMLVGQAMGAGAAGFRMRAGWRSPGSEPLAIWQEIERAGLAVSLVGPAASFADGGLQQVAMACPTLPLVLEHGGGLGRPDVGDFDAALSNLCKLGTFANISIKLPGLGQLVNRKPLVDDGESPLEMDGVGDLVSAMIGNFGADRIMWGSDFPPVAAREGYANALNWCRDLVREIQPAAVPAIFGGSAAKVWFS